MMSVIAGRIQYIRLHEAPAVYSVVNMLLTIIFVPYFNLMFSFLLRTLRLIARNNKINEIKNLMQESVGHGAPNPKLVKLEEIILQHFR
jgi:hypothetical protein